MKTITRVSTAAIIGLIMGLVSDQSHAQPPVIGSLSLNGELICAGLKPGSTATVEWAPTVNGPWTNSWAGLDAVEVGDDGTIRVKVPMFFRVRGEPGPVGPAGMVWIRPGTFTMGSPPSERGRDPDEGPQTVVTLTKGPCKNKSRRSKRKGDILHEGVIGVVKVEDYREANVYSP